MKKVGIMGGTFNPIHNSHLAMAQDALEQFSLDEILFIPSGTPYCKDVSKVLPGSIRYDMCQLAIKDNPSFRISDIEILREGNTYSYETIAELKRLHPDVQYYFIVGADSLFYMEKWYHPERIFGEVVVLVAVRDEKKEEQVLSKIEELKTKFTGEICLLKTQANSLSSTYLRDCVKEGKSIQYYVPNSVKKYIQDHSLYQN